MNFFREVISHLMKQAFEGHTQFSICDDKAIGPNPVRSISLDAVPANDEVIVSLAWDGGTKLFEKKLSDSEASHQFSLLSNDLAEVAALTKKGEYDSAKELMKALARKYTEHTGDIVPTNIPKLHNTQAEKDIDKDLWKQAAQVKMQNVFPSGTVQNLTFESTEDLKSYQDSMKAAQPSKPLWEQEGEKRTPEVKNELVVPSMSYEDLEQEKEKEQKNIGERIEKEVKEQIESSLAQKQATLFTDKDKQLVDALRGVGRSWEEVRDFMTKSLKYEKEDVAAYLDQFRGGEKGQEIDVVREKSPEDILRPPKDLVTDETHNRLLDDLKKEKPVEEVKEKEIEKVDEPIIEESAKKGICPECDGEGAIPVVRGGRVIAEDCPSCGGDKHVVQAPKELESSQEEIARADNAEIRKIAWKEHLQDVYKNFDEFNNYNEVYNLAERLGFTYAIEAWAANPVVQGSVNPEDYKIVSSLKEKVASYMNISETDTIEKVAIDNPLQEPIKEEPTMETPVQDRVPMGRDPLDHNKPAKGDRVFVSSDLGTEKAGFEATYISEYKSKGTDFSIVETDDGDLLDIESHRVVKTSEGAGAQVAEPVMEPQIEKPQEEEIPVTPSTEKLTSLTSAKRKYHTCPKCESGWECEESECEDPKDLECKECHKKESSQDDLLTIKAEAEQLLKIIKEAEEEKDVCSKCGKEVGLIEMSKWVADGLCSECRQGKTAFCFSKEGLKKEARQTDSAFEGDGWVRVWVDQMDVELHPEYKNALAQSDEASKIAALKEIARRIAYNQLEDAKTEAQLYASFNFNDLVPSDHDRIDWVALASPQVEAESSLKQADSVMDTKCEECGKLLGPEAFLSKWPVCGECTRKRHKKVTQSSDFEKGISQNKTADEPVVEPKTKFKELKISPKYVEKEKAVPASPELDVVLSKMDSLEQNLATLDRAKQEITAKLQEEIRKIDERGERVRMEEELQASVEKASVLINAIDSKIVSWRDKLLALQEEEVSYVPRLTPKEMLERIYKKFSGAEKFVQDVLNGLKGLAKTVTEKTLIRWPAKKSSLDKQASPIDMLNQYNDELLAALKELSSPL